MTALEGVDDADRAQAEELLRAVGEVLWVADDAAIDAVTAVSGSGPAYVLLFLEALMEAAEEQGLTADQARQLALGTFHGATQLATLSPDAPSVLRERVTSKGGTTAAALAVFQDRGLSDTIRAAVAAAARRAKELAREFSA
jgi:pyrroline-5-carboxylate reductase